MIKIENVVLPSADMVRFAIEGMRNPMNSWEKSDTTYDEDIVTIGDNDLKLMKRLSNGGAVHSKYLRMLEIGVRITAPLYWYKEFETYRVGVACNSCSTMHKIHSKPFTLDDFSREHLVNEDGVDWAYFIHTTIEYLNKARDKFIATKDKKYWWQMIQLLPSSYNQTRNVTLNYEVLKNIYRWRKDHKLDEWRIFCEWIETLPYAKELIVEPVEREIRKDKLINDVFPKVKKEIDELYISVLLGVLDNEKVKERLCEISDILGESKCLAMK